jgi:hypothetical protein
MNIFRKFIFCSFCIIMFGGISSGQNPPFEWPSSYTIEYVQKAPGDPTKNVYSVSGNKTRNETTDLKMNNNNISVTIFDLDKQVMFSLNPSSSVYQKTSLKGMKNEDKVSHMFDTNGTWEKISSEDINGVVADKYKLINGNPEKYLFIWLSQKTNEPLKATNWGGTWLVEITKYVSGPMDDSLFTVPAGYSEI